MGAVKIQNNGQFASLTAVYDMDHGLNATAYTNAGLTGAISLPHDLDDDEVIYLPNGLNFRLTITIPAGPVEDRVLSQSTLQTVNLPPPALPDLGQFVTQTELDAAIAGVSGGEPAITAGTSGQLWQGDKTWVNKTALPVSTATQTALDLKADLASPALTGNPTAPTQSAGNNSTRLATTAYADTAAAARAASSHTPPESDVTSLTTDLGLKAPLASPTFTGTPAAPTASAGTNTTQLATTAFATAGDTAVVGGAPSWMNTLAKISTAINDDASYATTTTTALALKAPLASPALTGSPTAPTQTALDNSTKIATTAYADNVAYLRGSGDLLTVG